MSRPNWAFQTKPFEYQREIFEAKKTKENFALLMEQGTGKSKIVIDIMAWRYCTNLLDAAVIFAPNGVHLNWLENEFAKHWPEHIPLASYGWRSNLTSKKEQKKQEAFLNDKRMCVLCMNIDAVITKRGLEFIKKFYCAKLNVMCVVDESTIIKNPRAKRTKRMCNFVSGISHWKCILTGTPVSSGPLDFFSQFGFLDKDILGHSFTVFKNRYARWKKVVAPNGRSFDMLLGYKNLQEIKEKIALVSVRRTKKECLDLPEKMYKKVVFEMSKKQAQIYYSLRDTYRAELLDLDNKKIQINVSDVLTRYMRLQQITNGFTEGEKDIELTNKRIEVLETVLNEINVEGTDTKVIIWARFSKDIQNIGMLLEELGMLDMVVRYTGKTSQSDRQEAIYAFQNEKRCRIFLGTASAGGLGITLTAASNVVYYSNDFNYITRKQSEDRAHRIGQNNKVTYIDLIAKDTIDSVIVDTLRRKQNVSSIILGEEVNKWI